MPVILLTALTMPTDDTETENEGKIISGRQGVIFHEVDSLLNNEW